METKAIYIVQYYPGGWFHCYDIPEKECIDAYLNDVSYYKDTVRVYHYDIFNEYMNLLYRPRTIVAITKNGQIIRYWNNQAWVVIEAFSTLQAVHKALDILTCDRTYVDPESLRIARQTNILYKLFLKNHD